jgi:hypothetical protein
MSTLRAARIPGPPDRPRCLWVSGLEESVRFAAHFDLVVDCCGRAGPRPNGIVVCPSAGNHRWAPEDLDRIVGAAVYRVRANRRVLIHCRSGRSRSTTAAAAVLLVLGAYDDPTAAIHAAARNPGEDGTGDAPDRRCVASLRAWWASWLRRYERG